MQKDRKTLELQAAREILTEVFSITLSEVNEMIENCFQVGEKWRSMQDNLLLQEP